MTKISNATEIADLSRHRIVHNYAISLRDILSTIIDCHEPFEHKLDSQ